MKTLRICFLGCTILAAVSCAKDPIAPQEITDQGREAMVSLSLRAVPENTGMTGKRAATFGAAEAEETAATRAINPDEMEEGTGDDYKVTDFWLLQYNHNGSQIGSARYYRMDEFDGGDLSVPVILPSESGITYRCVIIANTHSEGFGITLGQATTLDKLKALCQTVVNQDNLSNETTTGKRDLLMNCVVDITSATTQLDCDLYRNVAKLTLKLTNKAGSNVNIKSVQLRNVPNHMFYADQLYNDDPTPSPTTEESGFIDMETEACELACEDATDVIQTLVYYLPRNRRGESGADRAEDKNRNVPDYATFVEIMAEDATLQTPLRYRFYLGANMTSDFNIVPNHHYTLPVTIVSKGDADADSRVEDMGSVDLEPANSYIVNPTSGEAQPIYSVPITRINEFWQNEGGSKPITPATEWVAEVIWQDQDHRLINFCDADGSVKEGNTEFAGQGESYFRFKPVQGAQGNVLIGVRAKNAGNDAYLWSWHLWITDYNPTYSGAWQEGRYAYVVPGGEVHRYDGTTWTNNYQNKYIMDRNFGASGTSTLAASRGLYYQFGRKDPFPHSGTKLYDITGQPQQKFTASESDCIVRSQGTAQITTAAQHPYVFYWPSSGDWMMNNTYTGRLWNNPTWYTAASGSGKSLFDPCPPGWRLPISGTWSVFSRSNVKGSWSSGWNFYMKTEGTEGDETTYYPASGSRSVSSGTMANEGSDGYSWSASPSSATHGLGLYFHSGNVHPQSNSNRGYGFPLRCIQE